MDKKLLLIKLAATWEGIKAAEELEKEGINCGYCCPSDKPVLAPKLCWFQHYNLGSIS